MDEKVKACLDEQRKESEKLDKKNKRKLLAELGIYNKEYSDTYGNGYVQYDNETKKYYKIVFPDISDEEYLELKMKSDLFRGIPTKKESAIWQTFFPLAERTSKSSFPYLRHSKIPRRNAQLVTEITKLHTVNLMK